MQSTPSGKINLQTAFVSDVRSLADQQVSAAEQSQQERRLAQFLALKFSQSLLELHSTEIAQGPAFIP